MIYLQCTCLIPSKTSLKPSGRSYDDLRHIYQDISRADTIVAQYNAKDPETESWDEFQMNTAEFLSKHHRCVLQVVDSKGDILTKYW